MENKFYSMFQKKISLILFLVLLSNLFAFSQNNISKHRIIFTDKNNSPYSISKPSDFLSQKAIDRRSKQNISIENNDLPVNPAYVDSIKSTGVKVLNKSKWFNSVTIETSDSLVIDKILLFPFVLKVENVVPKDKSKSSRKGTKSINSISSEDNFSEITKDINSYNYGYSYNQTKMIAINALHDLNYRGKGMTIAVLDAGFYKVDTLDVFESLWANNQILGTVDFVNPGGNVFTKSTHGMMVLSTMAANIPSQMIGTAPEANYWLLRSEDAKSEYIIEEGNWAAAAEFADSVGADIINSSLSYTTFDDSTQNHSYLDMDGNSTLITKAADIAASKGIIVVVSAGNSGNGSWKYIGAPSDADSVLTIGAVDYSGKYASFSSIGPTSDDRIKPTIASQGLGTAIAVAGNTISFGNGTSFSSPIIAGAVACLWQANPELNNMEIIEYIKKSSSIFSNPDNFLGYGIPNFAIANLIIKGNKIDNFDVDNSVSVLPNPFSNSFYIIFSSNDTHTVNVELFDISGKRIFHRENLSRNLGYNYFYVNDLSNFSKGFYFLRLSSNGNVFTKKLIKFE